MFAKICKVVKSGFYLGFLLSSVFMLEASAQGRQAARNAQAASTMDRSILRDNAVRTNTLPSNWQDASQSSDPSLNQMSNAAANLGQKGAQNRADDSATAVSSYNEGYNIPGLQDIMTEQNQPNSNIVNAGEAGAGEAGAVAGAGDIVRVPESATETTPLEPSVSRTSVRYESELEKTQRAHEQLNGILSEYSGEHYYQTVLNNPGADWSKSLKDSDTENFFSNTDKLASDGSKKGDSLADDAEKGFREMTGRICDSGNMSLITAAINSLAGGYTAAKYKTEEVRIDNDSIKHLFGEKVSVGDLIEKYGHLEEALSQAKLLQLPQETIAKLENQMNAVRDATAKHFKEFVAEKNKADGLLSGSNDDNVHLDVKALEEELKKQQEHIENLNEVISRGGEEEVKDYPKDYHSTLVALDHLVQMLPKTTVTDGKVTPAHTGASRDILHALVATGSYEAIKFALDHTTDSKKDLTWPRDNVPHKDLILEHKHTNGYTIGQMKSFIDYAYSPDNDKLSKPDGYPDNFNAESMTDELGKAMNAYAEANNGEDGWHMTIGDDVRNEIIATNNTHEALNSVAHEAIKLLNKNHHSGSSTTPQSTTP